MSEPFTKEQLEQGLARSPFIAFMGLEVLQADPANQAVTMRMAMRPEFERGKDTKQWHGGPIAAMIDTVGDRSADGSLAKVAGLPVTGRRVGTTRY
jgi:acyl-coenzyme A thioesterase PaaI-like protein